jgi:hypothetical protein
MANPALRRLGFAPDDRVLIIHADDVGMCHATLPAVVEGAEPAAVATEMRGQLDRALGAGIDVTHLDAHMGAALAAPFRADYVRLGLERGISPCPPPSGRRGPASLGPLRCGSGRRRRLPAGNGRPRPPPVRPLHQPPAV